MTQSGPFQSSAVTKPTLGQGLGTALPSLTSGKKKSISKGSKDKHVASQAALTNRDLNPEANLSATLQRLAEQTRQTVESIDAPAGGENITTEDMESFVKQFEALGGSQVLFQTLMFLGSFSNKSYYPWLDLKWTVLTVPIITSVFHPLV